MIYAWGSARCGRLALSDVSHLPHDKEDEFDVYQPIPCLVTSLTGRGIVQVACGKFHTLALTQEGEVLAWGLMKYGVLGISVDSNLPTDPETNDHFQPVPKKIEVLVGKHVAQVACRSFHNMVATQSGEVYTWGLARYGMLGSVSAIPLCVSTPEDDFNIFCPTPILVEALQGTQVVKVACGDCHCVAIGSGGEVVTWGSARWGLAGNYITHPHHTDAGGDQFSRDAENPQDIFQPRPVTVQALSGMHVVQVACGRSHTLVVTEDGEVYGWGIARCGIMGACPRAGTYSGGATQTHSASLQEGEGGFLYESDGDSYPVPYQPVPTLIAGLAGKKIIQVACGDSHNLALSSRGLVHSWGDLALGCLGHPLPEEPGYYFQEDEDGSMFCNHPTLVHGLAGHAIVQVACGEFHSLAVSSGGRVFAWGLARHGLLGCPDVDLLLPPSDQGGPPEDDRFQPVPVEVPLGKHLSEGEERASLALSPLQVAAGAFASLVVLQERAARNLGAHLGSLRTSGLLADVVFVVTRQQNSCPHLHQCRHSSEGKKVGLSDWGEGKRLLPGEGLCCQEEEEVASQVEETSVMFQAHQAILAARSQYWAAQFTSELKDSQPTDGILKLKVYQCSATVFDTVLNWVYTDTVDLDLLGITGVLDMLQFSNMHLLDALQERCAEWLVGHLAVDNVAALWERSLRVQATALEAACTSFMVEHFVDVREHPNFMEVYRSEPKLADKMFALLTTPLEQRKRPRLS